MCSKGSSAAENHRELCLVYGPTVLLPILALQTMAWWTMFWKRRDTPELVQLSGGELQCTGVKEAGAAVQKKLGSERECEGL